MSNRRLYCSFGLAAHLGWARLLVDRYRDLVEIPAPAREDPCGGLHHFAPDDEGAFEVLDTPPGVSIESLLAAAESRLGFPLEPSIEWLSSDSTVPNPVRTDRALTDLLKSLPSNSSVSDGCFRFTASAAPKPPAPPAKSSCCGGGGGNSCDSSSLDAASKLGAGAARDTIQVVLNGSPVTVVGAVPSHLLVDWLREDQGLTGTKIGCGEGGCGACTVAVRPSGTTEPFVAINSCLRLLCACDGLDILTTEGCGSDAKGFSDVQQAIADGNGSQCGFCTPGWVMNMEALLQQNPTPTRSEVEQQFDGNLCRCTGYRPILDAFKDLACGPEGEDKEEEEEHKVIECRLDLNHCGDMEDIAGCKGGGSGGGGAAAVTKKSGGGCCKRKQQQQQQLPPSSPPASSSSSSMVHVVDRTSGDEYIAPSNLPELALVLAAQPSDSQFRLVSGNTAMGVAKYFNEDGADDGAGNRYGQPPEGNSGGKWVTVDVAKVREMRAIEGGGGSVVGSAQVEGPFGLSVGASVPINDLIKALESHFVLPSHRDDASQPEGPRRRNVSDVYSGVVRHLKRVANTQVRGSGTWAGNLTLVAKNNTFASDIALVFTALGVELEVMDCAHKSQSTTRRVSVEEWLSSAPSSKQVLVRGHFPSLLLIPDHSTHMWYSDKTAQRHVNSHPIASVACLLVLNHQQVFPNWRKTLEGCVIAPGSSIVVGGLFSPAIRRCRELETAMQGSRIDRDLTLQKGLAALDGLVEAARKSGVGLSEDRQNTTSYRVALVRTFLYKTFLTANKHRLPHDLKSAAEPFAAAEDRPVSRGHQLFLVPEEESGQLPVGLAVPKLTARLQASGEAKYPSDNVGGKLWGAFVLSTKSHATLVAIDSSKAAAMPGFAGIVTSDDVAGVNAIDVHAKVFIPIGSPCPYIGAPVAVVVADSNKRARAAAKAVMLTFGNDAGDPADDEGFFGTEGASIDVGAARADFDKNSPLASRLRLRSRNKNSSDGVSVMRGDPDSVLGAAAAVQGGGEGMQSVRGRTSMCGQRHFHLETHTTQAAPDEDRRIVLTSGAQFPQYTQAMVAKVLSLPVHRVEVKTRRVGGAYGAKIVSSIFTAAAAAVAARALNKTVLMQNERVDDMTMLGGREGMEFRYNVAFENGGNDSGRISALDMLISMDGANSPAQAVGDLSMAVDWSDGCYYVGDFRSQGDLRFSARPNNTSCRAPGNLQSISCRELVNEHVAFEVNLPLHVVQERNMYVDGQVTPFGDEIGSANNNWTIPDLWRRCKASSEFDVRLAAADAFNATNRFRKRGVAMVPTKYGMGPSGYKVGCVVNAYANDGTIEVFHSGVEIGQGINTKVAQAVAMALGVDLDSIIVGDQSTSVIPNGGCTGGSGTSESCVGAALLACAELNTTLEPFKSGGDDDGEPVTFADAASAASGAGLSLSATGWFNSSPASETGSFDYFTQGVGMAEVEIDCLTGEVQILRCDIHMDLGQSLNPAVDVGQIEGGFVMALGYMLTEEVLFGTKNGKEQGYHDSPGSGRGHSRDQVQINLGTWNYKVPSAYDIPQVLNVTLMPNTPNPSPAGVLSSKGVAEPPMALAASVMLAVKQAVVSCRKDALQRLRTTNNARSSDNQGASSSSSGGGGGGGVSALDTELSRYVEMELPLTVERIQQACKVSDSRVALRLH